MLEWCYCDIHINDYADYDGFLSGSPPGTIIIDMNGADGMDGVTILWFSDDGGFGTQSYRLGCAYFHKKPISPEIPLGINY